MDNTLVREVKPIDANSRPADLLRIVTSKGFVLTLAGIGVAGMIALGSTRLMGDMLYKTSPSDPNHSDQLLRLWRQTEKRSSNDLPI